ncbi:hypothetical protein LO762_13855 [Actinocorallia sp. API 0066]|uniref:hypothetical protein n=1 Tax=Actinocorallia sp. API 0066 TaxID=2896846 RepID=UPI001E4105DE|nr:hypothetical protein [Actinocorallia sp. API 0066]MCD0450269.1 hypothetical protein [Actinocorallia sp. API 0066]
MASSRAAVLSGVRTRMALAGVLAVLAAALLAGTIVLGMKAASASREATWRDEALAAGRQTALNMMTLDYRTVNDDMKRVLSSTTGAAKDQYASNADTFVAEITKTQATSQAQVLSAGLTGGDGDSAEVIVAVSAVVTNPQVPQGTPRYMRFVFDVTNVDGKWLVSKFGVAQ